MQREWAPEELVSGWTLVENDWQLVERKRGASRLAFALLLKFFELEGRFPRHVGELPRQAITYLAEQVRVDTALLSTYDWSGRTIEYHRAQIRAALDFRECSREDEARLQRWLAEEVCPIELADERQREALIARCRGERIEPPATGQIARLVGGARAAADQRFCDATLEGLPAAAIDRLEELIRGTDKADDDGLGLLAELKADPGALGLETLLAETEKLVRVRALGLPATLFSGVSEKLISAWRSRAAAQYPSDLRTMARPARLTLLAVLCSVRAAEITDGLVDVLIHLIHRINARAERRVEGEMTADLRRVQGKEGILFRVAEAAIEHPDETVRTVVYPVVGEATLRDLLREARANEVSFQQRVRTVLRSSYSTYYRRMLPTLLASLEFRCNNTAHRPVMDALALLRRYAGRERVRFYDTAETVPVAGVVPAAWHDAVIDDHGRVERIPYEMCVLTSLRSAIRRREIWVVGATRWRDPEADLPGDFELNRDMHYAAIRQPLDATAFIGDLRRRLDRALTHLSGAMAAGQSGGVQITRRRGEPWITVPKLERLAEPAGLAALKDAVVQRYGSIDLLDILKDADHFTGLTQAFVSVASREAIPQAVLRRRLLLVLFALGTNMGIRQMVATGEHGETEAALRHVRRHFVTRDNLRRAITHLVNATFAVRDSKLWGEGTACASDSKRFGAWDSGPPWV